MKQLITGGIAAGKRRLAFEYAYDWQNHNDGDVIVIEPSERRGLLAENSSFRATPKDKPQHWQYISEAEDLTNLLNEHSKTDSLIIVDSLTFWLAEQLAQESQCWQQCKAQLLACIADLPGPVIFISNEVGQGIVPMCKEHRLFADELGWLNQDVGKLVERLFLCVVGIGLQVKGN
ncbi:bifunctional adenosylcobinamide kinase/adenosylcobinamide-phosphate guanylyltransferase [Shewanella sp. TC10]|uniref:bifunctional adenosylcobinamide kinase/adenosylcobinamide-phosphate guanylyltransferase n=1 Tax=Shewanella sp. TC10 TaxID=1419739 RepID=UPI00129ECD64|nr:bifunctional adenosylcobinamide kinase/adenosylcobinamide-phosphate guanylyltransferase [Shewanella sp. TC10]